MAGLKVSRGHHLATPQEIQDSLNPVPDFIEFTKVAQPADPSGNTLGRLWYNTATNRISFLRRNDGDTAYEVVDLEDTGSGGTSFIGFTADADLNMGTFDIVSNNIIKFNLTATTPLPIGSEVAIWTENTGDLHVNVPDGKKLLIEVNDVLEYSFGAGALELEGNNLAEVNTILFDSTIGGVQTIGAISTGLEFRTAINNDYSWWINGTEEFTMNNLSFTFGTNKLIFEASKEIYSSGNGLIVDSGGGINQWISLETNSFGRILIEDDAVTLQNSAEFRANANAIFLDADNDTKWQAGTDDVAQLTIGGITPAIEISVSQAGTVFTNEISTGGGIDLLGNSITNGSIDASLIDTGILAMARGGTSIGTNVAGDIMYAPTANNWSRLAIGGTGQMLRVVGGLPAWFTLNLDNIGDVSAGSPAIGNVLTWNGSAWINQAPAGGTNITEGNSMVDVDDGAGGAGTIKFFVDDLGTSKVDMVSALWTFKSVDVSLNGTQDLIGIKALEFTDNGTLPTNTIAYIQKRAPNMHFNVDGGDGFLFTENEVTIVGIADGLVDVNDNYIQMDAITAPTDPPATERRIFVDDANDDKLSVKRPDGEVIEAEGHRHGEVPIATGSNAYMACSLTGDGTQEIPLGGTYYAMPFIPPEDCTVTDLAYYVITAGSSDADGIMGIYSNAPNDDRGNYPDQKLGQIALGIDNSTTGAKFASLSSSVKVKGGRIYWLVYSQQNGGTEPNLSAYDGLGLPNVIGYRNTSEMDINANDLVKFYRVTQAYLSTMPTSFPTGATALGGTADCPAVFARASVP